jgi:hypothetical protein
MNTNKLTIPLSLRVKCGLFDLAHQVGKRPEIIVETVNAYRRLAAPKEKRS